MAVRDEFSNVADLYKMYCDGKSANELGVMCGVRAGTIIYHFKKHGLKLRSVKEALENRDSSLKSKISDSLKKRYASGDLISWQKGLTKETDERIKNIGLSRRGKKAANWKGGRTKHPAGHIRISRNGRQFWEHHEVWCHANDFHCVPRGCVVHHRNFNPADNRPENLMLLDDSTHKSFHAKLRGEIK